MKTSDVIVVGGGVIGTSIAYHLAREGLAVTLFERDELASQASGAAAGMLAPICESAGDNAFSELGLRSLAMFPALVEELKELSGIDPQLVESGMLRAALSEEEAVELRRQSDPAGRFGLEWLSAEAAREREPLLTPQVHGALWSPTEGHVYSPLLAQAYAEAASRLGAAIHTGIPVLGLIRDGDHVLGVSTASGQWGAAHVVLAAGVWTRYCAEWLGDRLPLEPVKGQILALDLPRPAFRTILWSGHTYLVPKRNGTVVVGATEERVGFDRRITAAGIAGLISAAAEIVPALGGCTFRHAWCGLRPDTPDHLPVIGPVPGVSEVILAAGHYRNGVLLSPVTGKAVADWIVRKDLPHALHPYLPDRLLNRRR
ncbi:MAG: thiO [Armatimonadetes bacterium]|nr:thiO [Armatimonadota bacterium]